MIQRALRRAYRRLGPRYPRAAIVGQLQLVYVPVVLSIGLLALYVPMSAGEFLRLAFVACALFVLYFIGYWTVARPLLLPVERWIEGERGPAAAAAAWIACASFPRGMMRREWLSGALGAFSWLGLVAWAAYAAWELNLPVYAVIPLFAGIAVVVIYVQSLRFFALEQVLRPVLEDIARDATDEVDLHAAGLPLRARMLAALPAINVVTGVAAVGITGIGHGLGLSDLGLAVVISAAIAGTISLALTLLVSDSIAAPIDALREATDRVARADFAARVPVVTTDETGELARTFNQMAAGLEERERIREAFGTYVDRDVAEHILREGTSLAGEEVEVTMMFIDVRDFTRFAEQASAAEVVATVNRLFERTVPIVHGHEGQVDKFVGDGLLAVFGAPRRQANHADQALAAALDIATAVRDEFAGELEVGIGLNSGLVVAGNVGGGGRLEFSVIGDAVNVAARVESATRQTGDVILLSENTRRLLKGEVELEERPTVPLKGRANAVALHTPVGMRVDVVREVR